MSKAPAVALALLMACLGCGEKQRDVLGDNTLCLALSEDPLTLDPAFITDVAGGAMAAKIFDGLMRFDTAGKVVGSIAKSWDVSPDAKTYTFFLRDNVVFHNGRKMKARDVLESFRRILDPQVNSPRRWVLEAVEDIAAPEPGIVRITLSEPFAPFLSMLAMPNAAILPMEELQRDPDAFGKNPLGTGPFRMKEWERDKRIVLESNPDYFEGPPQVAGVEYRVIPEPWAALAEFQRGTLDIVAIPQGHLEEYLEDPDKQDQLMHAVGLNTYYLGVNCSRPPLDNPAVRRALAMAIDTEKMVSALLARRAIPAANPVPPVLDRAFGGIPAIPYDPDGARALLKEAGAENLTLRLYQASSLDVQEMMEVVQDYLARVGVRVRIVQREWSSFKQAVVEGEADLFFLSWWADYPDPENFLYPNFHSGNFGAGGNKARFQDEAFDAMIEQARRHPDADIRRQLYLSAASRVVEMSPWIFLWHRADWVLRHKRVQGWTLPRVYNADKLTEVRLTSHPSLRGSAATEAISTRLLRFARNDR